MGFHHRYAHHCLQGSNANVQRCMDNLLRDTAYCHVT
jgi:hypothetical protein